MGPTKYLIRVPGEFETPEGINEALISAPEQVPVRVRDVARVEFGYKEITSKSRLNGYESVSLSVIKRSGENLLAIRAVSIKLFKVLGVNNREGVSSTILPVPGKGLRKLSMNLRNITILVSSWFLWVCS